MCTYAETTAFMEWWLRQGLLQLRAQGPWGSGSKATSYSEGVALAKPARTFLEEWTLDWETMRRSNCKIQGPEQKSQQHNGSDTGSGCSWGKQQSGVAVETMAEAVPSTRWKRSVTQSQDVVKRWPDPNCTKMSCRLWVKETTAWVVQ